MPPRGYDPRRELRGYGTPAWESRSQAFAGYSSAKREALAARMKGEVVASQAEVELTSEGDNSQQPAKPEPDPKLHPEAAHQAAKDRRQQNAARFARVVVLNAPPIVSKNPSTRP